MDNDYTLRWDGKRYQIERQAVTTGLRRANVRVEQRLDGSLAVRFGERYLPVTGCPVAEKPKAARVDQKTKPRGTPKGRGSDGTRRITRTPHRLRQKGTFLLCQRGDISILP